VRSLLLDRHRPSLGAGQAQGYRSGGQASPRTCRQRARWDRSTRAGKAPADPYRPPPDPLSRASDRCEVFWRRPNTGITNQKTTNIPTVTCCADWHGEAAENDTGHQEDGATNGDAYGGQAAKRHHVGRPQQPLLLVPAKDHHWW
jgi:hypothetical protein